MESFYNTWLKNNKKENEIATKTLRSDTSLQQNNNSEETKSQTLESNQEENSLSPSHLQQDLRTGVIYQNNNMELYIEKGTHLRQIRFRLQDHMFYMKIKLINPLLDPPLLRDILQFLETAFNHVLEDIKKFYKEEDHNIAFLTLYQTPMICGLNTGTFKACVL